jgi:hypothetical protein
MAPIGAAMNREESNGPRGSPAGLLTLSSISHNLFLNTTHTVIAWRSPITLPHTHIYIYTSFLFYRRSLAERRILRFKNRVLLFVLLLRFLHVRVWLFSGQKRCLRGEW